MDFASSTRADENRIWCIGIVVKSSVPFQKNTQGHGIDYRLHEIRGVAINIVNNDHERTFNIQITPQ